MHRRSFLKGFGAALAPAAAFAQNDDPLQQLIQQNQRSDIGQGFDSASRTIQMPKSSLPTLSPATVQTHRARNRTLRADRGGGRLADGAADRPVAARGAQSGGRAAAHAAEGSPAISIRARSRTTSTIPMSRPRCGASRRATGFSADGRPGHAHLQGAEHSGRAAAEPAQDQSRAAARLRHQGRRTASSCATFRPRSSRRSRTAP